MADQVFWRRKTLEQMTAEEWESLCDGCGKCCLHKLEDEDTGEIYYTDVACRYLDSEGCHCQAYDQRKALVPDCVVLKPTDVTEFHWLPSTCAYRLISEGQPLADWHPLVSGDPASVQRAGVSVAGRIRSEDQIAEEDWEECIVHWIG